MKYLACTAVAMALFADVACARDRVELAPYSSWVANYDTDSCALQRQFGEPGRQVFLELRQFGSESEFQVTIASKDFDRRMGRFKIGFAPIDAEARDVNGFDMHATEDYEGKLFSYTMGSDVPALAAAYRDFVRASTLVSEAHKAAILRSMDMDRASQAYARLWQDEALALSAWQVNRAFQQTEAARDLRDGVERAIDGIAVEDAFDEQLFLRTGSLHAPMEAMRTCLDELSLHWGIDAEAHKTLSRPVLPLDYARLVREVQEDYPRQMANKGMQGYLRVRLNVSAEGEPTACHMQSPINDEAFERVACANMMRHARFAPALDREGAPIASVYRTAIVYLLAG